MEFRVYDRDDPNAASPICTITDADVVFNRDGEAMEWRVGLNQEGAGLFNISRHHPLANRTDLPDNAYIKVVLPEVSSEPIFAWWMDEFRATLISAKGEGGETISLFGPGIIDIFRRAVLYPWSTVGDQPARGSLDVEGKWHWIDEPLGAMLTRGIEEGQEQQYNPLAHVTIDFDRVTSSPPESATWPEFDGIFETTIGVTIHDLYQQLIARGDLFVVPEPSLLIHAYTAYGRDLSSSPIVHFRKAGISEGLAGNILTDLKRSGRGTRRANVAVVRGMNETYDVASIGGATPGQAIFVVDDTSDDIAHLQAVGLEALNQREAEQQAQEFEIAPGFDPDNGLYMPGPEGTNGHFWIGDSPMLSTDPTGDDWEYFEATARITGIRVALREAAKDDTAETAARSLSIVVELEGITQDGPPQVPQPRIAPPPPLQWEWSVCTEEVVLPPGTWLVTFDPDSTGHTVSGTVTTDYEKDHTAPPFRQMIIRVHNEVVVHLDGGSIFALQLPPKNDSYYECT